MSRLRVVPIVVAAAVATPALGAIALQVINGSLRLPVITISLSVVGVAAWMTYITGRRTDRLARRIVRLETTLHVSALDTGRFRRPAVILRRVD